MALRTATARKPVTPKRAIPSPHVPGRTASPTSPTQQKPAILKSLSNLATLSGGTQPGQQQQDPNAPAPWESDPVLQSIQNMQRANAASAEASALAARNATLINFGYAPELDSLYGDAGTAGAAKANPNSILETLKHGHDLRQQGLNENLNRSNLWYSSTRGQQLGEEGRQYLGEQYGAGQSLQSTLGKINEARLAALQGGQQDVIQGEQSAYDRWQANQLQYGLGADPGATPAPLTGVRKAVIGGHAAQRRSLLRRRY